ncbi:Gfo/Idh/MocA family protein [Heyndrickxia sp. NPDC080065]|uniref:Gfo/Idh/MocA family protein n=1 Tax=Heyndrickxia sp. NPDC080065 TaxID=3390568 RepID=UPI003D05E418
MGVNFGLIGCGYISKCHIEALATFDDAKLVAVSDLINERMSEAIHHYKKLSNEHHLINLYENYTEMLKNDEVDVVIVCTVPRLHAEMAKAVLMAEKHVILEKPMSLSLKDADEIIQLAKDNNREVCICHPMRFKPIIKRIKQIIDEGIIGKPFLGIASIRINRSSEYYAAANWPGDWEKDGGILVNQGMHLIDLMQWFLGDIKNVYGDNISFSKTEETEDISLGIITFTNGAKGLIEANIITQPKNSGYQLSIFGNKGCISLEGSSLNKLIRWYMIEEETNFEHLEELLKDNKEYIYMYENFIHSIQDANEELLIDGFEGRKVLETIFSIYHSFTKKMVIDISSSSFSSSMKDNDAE